MRVLLASLVLIACGDDTSPGDTSDPRVTMSGHAYGFNVGRPVEGAVVSIAQHPELTTTTAADGSWSLQVPEGEATPFVTHESYITMHLETFTLDRAPQTSVNFQMVTPTIYTLLAEVLEITPDDSKCQIASTVSEIAIRDMTFEQFIAHGAHGVAGATAETRPASVPVVYFGEDVIPDRALTETSRDGGVVWANVPPGRYTLVVTHPSKQFGYVFVDCEAGRFINANPPQGLREL